MSSGGAKRDHLADAILRLRVRAEEESRIAATAPVASVIALCLGEIESAVRLANEEMLTLEQAAKESGYSTRTLRAKIVAGEIPQRGRKNAPRIRRADLPRKSARKATDGSAYNPAADALSLVRRS